MVAYDRRWPGDFTVLARRIDDAMRSTVVRVRHVGSTSVPELAAKDCIDVQVGWTQGRSKSRLLHQASTFRVTLTLIDTPELAQ